MQKTFFKKIIPSMLIVAILATGFFSAFRVVVVNAEEDNLFDKYLDEGKYQKIAIEKKPVNTQGTPGSGSSDNRPKLMTAGGGGEDAQKLYKEEQERKRLEREKLDSSTGCTPVPLLFNANKCIKTILSTIAQAMLEFFGFFVWISGKLLNIATQRTVLEMGSSFQDSQGLGVVVKEAWKTIRDLSNIIIIFMLLMIGIGIILRQEKYGSKKLLGMLIAVAILINFSLFFTNVVIDTSNLLALQFYNKVSEDKPAKWNGFSDSYMQAFGLSTWYSNTDNPTNDFSKTFTGNNGSIKNIFIIGILGSIMFLIASFAFLAGAFFLISRYVILIFLMIFSPIAFVGMILPATKTYTTQWINMLFKQAFFAPIYFLLTWFVISIINSPAYQASLGLLGSEKFANLAASETFSSGSIDLVLNFIIVIFFIILSIILSQQMGIKGSDMVIKWGQSAQKWGQGMVGGMVSAPFRYGARRGAESAKAYMGDKAHKFQKSSGGFARTLHKVPGVAYGVGKIEAIGRATVETSEDKYKNMSTEALKNIQKSFALPSADRTAINSMLMDREKGSPDGIIKYFKELPEYKRKEIFISMPAADQAKLIKNIKEEKKISDDGDEIKDLQNYLSEESKIKLRKEEKEVKVKEIERSIKAAIKKTPEEGKKEIKTIEEVIKDARKLKINFADLSAGILKHKDIATHITKEDIINIDVDGNLSKDDYTQFTKNIIEHGINEAKEQIIKSPIGKRFGGSKIVTENLETEFRNRNQK